MKDQKFKIGEAVKVDNPKVKAGNVDGHRTVGLGKVQYRINGRWVNECEVSAKSKGQKDV